MMRYPNVAERPSPDGPSESRRTHCPYCAFQCGMLVDGGEAAVAGAGTPGGLVPLRVRADPDFPVNRGQMCIKGFNAGALLEVRERLTSPLLRDAAGVLRPVSWEVALDYIAERMLRIKARHGGDALSAFGSGALTNEKA